MMNRDAKPPTKYMQIEFNSTLKGSYTTVKWDLSLGCKNGSFATTWMELDIMPSEISQSQKDKHCMSPLI